MPSSKRRRSPLTHFLCLPLTSTTTRPVFSAALQRFRDEASSLVASTAARAAAIGDNAVHSDADALAELLAKDARAVRPVGTLHLTLGVMSLDAGVERPGDGDGDGAKTLQQAIALLNELDMTSLLLRAAEPADSESRHEQQALPVAPSLSISLTGLHAMQAPSRTTSLYAAPSDPTGRLLPFCQQLTAAFERRGLLVSEDPPRPLKLHATVVNTVYAGGGRRPQQRRRGAAGSQSGVHNGRDGGGHEAGRRRSGPLRIDARDLIGRFDGFEWARDVPIDRVAICKMGAEKVLGQGGEVVDEAYEEVAMRRI